MLAEFHLVITFIKEAMFSPAFVCLFVFQQDYLNCESSKKVYCYRFIGCSNYENEVSLEFSMHIFLLT